MSSHAKRRKDRKREPVLKTGDMLVSRSDKLRFYTLLTLEDARGQIASKVLFAIDDNSGILRQRMSIGSSRDIMKCYFVI